MIPWPRLQNIFNNCWLLRNHFLSMKTSGGCRAAQIPVWTIPEEILMLNCSPELPIISVNQWPLKWCSSIVKIFGCKWHILRSTKTIQMKDESSWCCKLLRSHELTLGPCEHQFRYSLNIMVTDSSLLCHFAYWLLFIPAISTRNFGFAIVVYGQSDRYIFTCSIPLLQMFYLLENQ